MTAEHLQPPAERVVDAEAQDWERSYAMWVHLAGLIGGIVAAFSAGISLPFALVLVLILWLVKRDESVFVEDHGREAVNFQLSLVIYAVALVPIGIITCGLGFLLAIPIALLAIIGGALAAAAANRGEYYRYPATLRLLK